MTTQISAQPISSPPSAALPLTRDTSVNGPGGEIKLIPSADGPPANAVADDRALLAEESSMQLSASCARMPVSMAVSVPVREFRVRNLLSMAPGALIETRWVHGEDLPLSSGDVQLAWTEF